MKIRLKKFVLLPLLSHCIILLLSSCFSPPPRYETTKPSRATNTAIFLPTSTRPALVDISPTPTDLPMFTPTPDVPRVLPTLRYESNQYTVKSGDTLAKIALAHQVSVAQILAVNTISNPNLISMGDVFTIPPASVNELATDFKIIPDSELVYGPNAANFDTKAVVQAAGGFLSRYTLLMDEGEFSGSEIVIRVANEYSINPRLLLALLEYTNGWLTNSTPDANSIDYPMGFPDPYRKGLYNQLAWTANNLNRGFYLWLENNLAVWTLADGSVMRINPNINAGTAGVQYFMSLLYGKQQWNAAVGENGFLSVFEELFGYPFNYAYEPLLPSELQQPTLSLPFLEGDPWSFTSGPHGGWNDGSAWAALDFAPPGEPMGCVPSIVPVTASGNGEIVRSGIGAVVQDLDGDGIEQTGWSILYAHIATEGRAEVGEYLRIDDPIGFPSCEGGFSTGTHLHIARRYNGVWIAADGENPFIMDGWIASSAGIEYDGYLSKNGQTIEAWYGQAESNQISR